MQNNVYYQKIEEKEQAIKNYFGEDADLYKKIYLMHYEEGVSYEKLGYYFHRSHTQVRNMVKKLETILEFSGATAKRRTVCWDDIMDGEVSIANNLMGGVFIPKLSVNAFKIFFLSIYLYQSNMNLEIPREFLLTLSATYKDRNRRQKLIEELNRLHVSTKDSKDIKIYEYVLDCKSGIRFELTNECLGYINNENSSQY